jgi:hypothetical protein
VLPKYAQVILNEKKKKTVPAISGDKWLKEESQNDKPLKNPPAPQAQQAGPIPRGSSLKEKVRLR